MPHRGRTKRSAANRVIPDNAAEQAAVSSDAAHRARILILDSQSPVSEAAVPEEGESGVTPVRPADTVDVKSGLNERLPDVKHERLPDVKHSERIPDVKHERLPDVKHSERLPDVKHIGNNAVSRNNPRISKHVSFTIDEVDVRSESDDGDIFCTNQI